MNKKQKDSDLDATARARFYYHKDIAYSLKIMVVFLTFHYSLDNSKLAVDVLKPMMSELIGL